MPIFSLRCRVALTALLVLALSAPATLEAKPATSRQGTLKISYQKARNENLRELAKVLRDERVFDIAIPLAQQLRLPQDIPVTFAECGEDNAFYDPETRSITMCYELFAELGRIFADEESTDEEVGQAMLGAAFFIFLHEFGHGLVHLLDLPITGKEEDAVDDLATLILINAHEEAAAAAAIGHFGELADQYESGSSEDLAFWDEHSLSAQRVFSIACLLFGSNPEAFEEMVGDDGLPEDRAVRCPEEFQQKSRAWDKLLAPHLATP